MRMIAGAQVIAQVTEPVRRRFGVTVAAAVALFVTQALSAPAGFADTLDTEIDRLKADVADLSQTLYELEEEVLYPADTQVAVFLTLKDREGLELDTVELYLDDTPVASHLYTERERSSLKRGGVQRLYIGNLPHGTHQLKAVLTARSANERFVRRAVTHDFRKRPGESRIQMTLDARAPDFEPVVSFQEWK
ncbi:MAG: AraC family transcriptional regulator [Marinobacter sp.]|uniref:AraC family transcriptional regulator n=1 Tax=Marinobacter sp. TaxID=50741 RepID=UPI003296BD8C